MMYRTLHCVEASDARRPDRVTTWALPNRGCVEPRAITDDPTTLQDLLIETGPVVWPAREEDGTE